jgi:BirA family transcriptional regulator, biotin operon repressor / biotin---[acetyl-CoA-carboxylase] ligase
MGKLTNPAKSSNPYKAIESGTPGRIGWRIEYFDEVGSTQRVAADMAAEGAEHGTVVIAERQNAGRGRLGRSWHSPAGVSLYVTMILRPTLALSEVSLLSLTAGVAAAETLEPEASGLVGLKWPNDIWLNGRKAGGIIAEAVTEAGALVCVLLGIGLNINLAAEDIPPELEDKATSLLIATGHRGDRVALAERLFDTLDKRYAETVAGGFASLRARYEKYFVLKGRRVAVVDSTSRLSGEVAGVDDDGALMLVTETGQVRILTGDVSLEGAYD